MEKGKKGGAGGRRWSHWRQAGVGELLGGVSGPNMVNDLKLHGTMDPRQI